MAGVFDPRVFSDQTHQAGEATYRTKAEREKAAEERRSAGTKRRRAVALERKL